MKYKTHFAALWRAVQEMPAQYRAHEYMPAVSSGMDIDDELSSGREITDLSELDIKGGILSIQGRQVLLYIPDQGRKIHEVLVNPSEGRRFHVADCKTLQDMRAKGRFERYKVTNNLSGVFKVSGEDYGHPVEGDARLEVCRNCLTMLNYRGYRTGPRSRSAVFQDFTLQQFFESYSTFFRYLPQRTVDRQSGYAEGWQEISSRIRAQANWTCQQCAVNLGEYRHLLHVHHVDGNKRNNAAANLRALCADCHRKQPLHESMFVKATEMTLIHQLRRAQGQLGGSTRWPEIYQYLDPAFEGVARILEKQIPEPPEVGYDIDMEGHGVVLSVELAWPARRLAIVPGVDDKRRLSGVGWRAKTVDEVLRG